MADRIVIEYVFNPAQGWEKEPGWDFSHSVPEDSAGWARVHTVAADGARRLTETLSHPSDLDPWEITREVIAGLTGDFAALEDARPDHVIDYITRHFGPPSFGPQDVFRYQQELLNQDLDRLVEQTEEAKRRDEAAQAHIRARMALYRPRLTREEWP